RQLREPFDRRRRRDRRHHVRRQHSFDLRGLLVRRSAEPRDRRRDADHPHRARGRVRRGRPPRGAWRRRTLAVASSPRTARCRPGCVPSSRSACKLCARFGGGRPDAMPQTPESGLEPPTWKRLALSAAIAAAAATVALVAFVLPAEYGIDPLGIGRALGLTALSEGAETRTIEIVDVVGGNETVIAAEIPAAGEPV